MQIHHSYKKAAERLGATLEQMHDIVIVTNGDFKMAAHTAKEAVQEIAAVKMLTAKGYRVVLFEDDHSKVIVFKGDQYLDGSPMLPHDAADTILTLEDARWLDEGSESSTVDSVERIGTVPIDGKVAYVEGFRSIDNPYMLVNDEDETEYTDEEQAAAWDEAWDAAADEHEGDEGKGGGSVVGTKYRVRYAEAGHPTHCGDWLAEMLNSLCLTKQNTDLGRFETICLENGVDTSKYRRTGIGWQGRIRMTGRNLLAKKVYMAGGVLSVPQGFAEDPTHTQFKAPADWMAAQRFKMPKAVQDQPIPEAK